MSVKKLLCFKESVLVKVCVLVALAIALTKIAGLCIPNWFYQGQGLKEWKGNLFRVYNSGGLIETKEYSYLSAHYESDKYGYPQNFSAAELSYYEVSVLSLRFSMLSGMMGYLILSSFSASLNFFLFILFLLHKKFPWPFCCATIIISFQLVLEIVSIIILRSTSSFTLYSDCHYLTSYDSSEYLSNTCADVGCIFNLIFSVFIVLFDAGILTCLHYRQKQNNKVDSISSSDQSSGDLVFSISNEPRNDFIAVVMSDNDRNYENGEFVENVVHAEDID